MRSPLVSIIMPAYNHGPFVEQAVRSVWDQTHRPIELIAIDDCSRDDTASRLEQLAVASPIPMKFERNPQNLGVTKTLNRALRLADGEWIGFLASDDFYEPEKTAWQLRELEALGPSYGCIHADSWIVDEQSARTGRAYESVLPPMRGDAFLDLAYGRANMLAITALVRRSLIEEIGGFDETLHAEDFDFHLSLAQRTRYAFLAQPVSSSRMLPRSLGKSPQRYLGELFQVLHKHREALGGEFPGVLRKRALHGCNIALAHRYFPGLWLSLRAGSYPNASIPDSARLWADAAVVASALAGRAVLASRVPSPVRKAASRVYQQWLGR